MDYAKARKLYKNFPVKVQCEITAKLIEYLQSFSFLMTWGTANKRNRERRYFIKLVGEYLDKKAGKNL